MRAVQEFQVFIILTPRGELGKQTSCSSKCKCHVIYSTFYGIKAYKCLKNDCDKMNCLLVLLTYKSIYCLMYIVYKIIFVPSFKKGIGV